MDRNGALSEMQIGAVATRSGLTTDTVRFYEKQGLVAKPLRSAGGFRLYSAADVDRLRFVSRAQKLGFSLEEIRELLLLRDSGSEGCSHVHGLLTEKIAMVHQKLQELRRMERQLKSAKARCDAARANECTASCPVLNEITQKSKEVQ